MTLDSKWNNKIASLVNSNPGQMSQSEYSYIAEKISSSTPCNVLVFGLGKDSFLWQEINQMGKTTFIEHDEYWFKTLLEQNPSISAYLVKYKTKLAEWNSDLSKARFEPNFLDLFLSAEVCSTSWDYIIVDAPLGYSDEMPGRIQSIYMASRLAHKNRHTKKCDVFVHDCDRVAENVLSEYFLGHINLQAQVEKLRHYQILGRGMPLMKKAIYTAIIDDYDVVRNPLYFNKDYDYFLFTNTNAVKSNFWTIVKVVGSGVKLARHIKIRPDLYLSDYDFSVWLDANVIQACDMNSLACLAKYDMMTMKHPERDCIYQEVLACEQLGKDKREMMDKQVNRYKDDGYPANHGLIGATILFRYHNTKVQQLIELWDSEVQMYSHRDQLSFNYCFFKRPLDLALLPWSKLHTHFRYLVHEKLMNTSDCNVIENRELIGSFINMGTTEHQFPVSGSIFTQPKRLKYPYSWVEHIPFAFFLVNILKPKIFVELGVHTGNSYNAFCQAVEMLNMDTQCYGIDTWRGDEHAEFYDESIYNELLAYQLQEYQDFSFLLKGTFDEMRESFKDNSIDLLHIDGFHTYEAVKHDFYNWLSKVSERGVVILHDTEVREHGFGVWKLWQEISTQYPSFNFKHGYGLGIVAVGNQVAGEFMEFLRIAQQEPFYPNLFARLGQYISLSRHNQKLENLAKKHGLRSTYLVQLFIDTGEGFSEAQVITQTITGEETQLKFDLSSYPEVKRLRFDPLTALTTVCLRQIILVDDQGESHMVLHSQDNAITRRDNAILIFDTDDPQIYIEMPTIGRWLKVIITLNYLTIGNETLTSVVTTEREKVQTLEQQIQAGHKKVQTLGNILTQNQLPTRYFAQLFVDTGTGFSEEQSITQEVTEFIEHKRYFEFDLSRYQNVKHLRFDPLNTLTAVQIEHITVVDGYGLTHQLNAQPVAAYARVGDLLIFDTEDPQVLVELTAIHAPQHVTIGLDYAAMGVNTYRLIVRMEQELIKQQRDKIRQLTQLVQR